VRGCREQRPSLSGNERAMKVRQEHVPRYQLSVCLCSAPTAAALIFLPLSKHFRLVLADNPATYKCNDYVTDSTHTHTHTLTRTHTFTPTYTHKHTHSLPHIHTQPHTHSHTYTTHTLTLTLTHHTHHTTPHTQTVTSVHHCRCTCATELSTQHKMHSDLRRRNAKRINRSQLKL
jgi:hypothetical protein